MPIQSINDIDLRIADIEAAGIEREAESFRGLGSRIGESISSALGSAEILQKRAIDEQKDKEAKALLASGVEGVNQYSKELGFNERSSMMFNKMAQMAKDPTQFQKIYAMQKAKSDKDIADKNRQAILSTLQVDLKDAIETSDPEKIAMVGNKINAAKASTTDQNTIKQLESIEKGLNSVRDRAKAKAGKPGEATKSILTLRKAFSGEAKDIDTVLRQTDVLRSAFTDGSFNGNRVGSDQALIMTFNKILDPTSVVRESEFARTGKSQGAVDAAAGWFQKLIEGGSGLTEDGRKAVFKMSELISQGTMIDRFRKMQEFERLGKIENIKNQNLDLIIPGFNKFKDSYMQWRKDPESYKKRITNELNETLSEAREEEVTTTRGTVTQEDVTPKPKRKRRVATSIEEF